MAKSRGLRPEEPQPSLGFKFFCRACGDPCNLRYADMGVGVPGPLEHNWVWVSECCNDIWYEDTDYEKEADLEPEQTGE